MPNFSKIEIQRYRSTERDEDMAQFWDKNVSIISYSSFLVMYKVGKLGIFLGYCFDNKLEYSSLSYKFALQLIHPVNIPMYFHLKFSNKFPFRSCRIIPILPTLYITGKLNFLVRVQLNQRIFMSIFIIFIKGKKWFFQLLLRRSHRGSLLSSWSKIWKKSKTNY